MAVWSVFEVKTLQGPLNEKLFSELFPEGLIEVLIILVIQIYNPHWLDKDLNVCLFIY